MTQFEFAEYTYFLLFTLEIFKKSHKHFKYFDNKKC